MKTLWKRIDGNKAWISLSIVTILQAGLKHHLILDTNFIEFLIELFSASGILAIGHHIKKGYFSPNKGN